MGDFIKEKAWKIVENIFQGAWDTLIKPFEMIPTFYRLVFGYKDDTLVYNTFAPHDITNIISPGVGNLTVIIGFIFVIAMIRGGMKVSSTGINPSNRTYFMEFVRDWVFVMLILGNISLLYDLLFTMNKGLIDFFKTSMELTGKDIYPPLKEGAILSGIFARLVLFGVTIWAYFYYLMRKITLMILMILGPVFISLFMFPSTRQITISWFRELIGTIFIQSVHAVVLWMIATIIDKGTGFGAIARGEDVGLLTIGLLYIIIIPLGEQLKALLNLNTGMNDSLSKTANMTGLAGLAGMANVVKGAMDGKSIGELTKGYMDRKRNNSTGNAEGEGTSAATPVDSSAKKMFRLSDMVSKGGKMVAGTAGTVAGMGLGPKGVALGSMAGFSVGDKIAPISRGMYVGAKGISGFATGGLKGAKKGVKEALESEAVKSLVNEQAEFDTKNWAAENKDAFMKDMNEKGITGNAADRAWNRKLNDQKKYFKSRARQSLSKHGIEAFNHLKARGDELASEAADTMTEQYASKPYNKEAFIQQFMNDAKKQGINPSEQMINNAWQQHLGDKRQQFLSNTKNLANTLSKGKGLDSFIDKEKFIEGTKDDKFLSAQENAFKSYYKANNPNATNEEVNSAWNKQKSVLSNELQNGVARRLSNLNQSPYGTGQQALGSAMSRQFAEDFKSLYADDKGKFKEAFVQKLKQDNPNMKEIDIERAWNEHVDVKYNDVLKAANNVAKELGTNPNVDNILNKKDFAEALKHSEATKAFVNSQEGAFKHNYLKENPLATGNDVNAAWMEHKQQLHDGMGRKINGSMSKVANTIPAIATQAKAIDLINAVTTDSMNEWMSKNSKEQFAKDLMSRPGNENLTQTQINQAWESQVANQKSYYKDQATTAAEQLMNGKPLDSFIDKGQFKQNVQAMRLSQAKDAFIKQYNGQATAEQIEQAWSSQLPNTTNTIARQLDNSISRVSPMSSVQGIVSGTHAKGIDLVEQATTELTKNYINNNKDSFYNDRLSQGMNIKQIDSAWGQSIKEYQGNVLGMANDTVKELSGGQSPLAFVDKNHFAQGLTARRVESAKVDFSNKLSGASPDFVQGEWERSGLESQFLKEGQQVVANIPKISASKGYELGQFMASHRASSITDKWAASNKQQFFNAQRSQGIEEPRIEQLWESKVGEQYSTNLSHAQKELANTSSKNIVIPQHIGSIIKGATSGGLQGMYEGSGVKSLVEVGKTAINYHALGTEPAVSSFKEAETKQLEYKNTLAFAAGVIGGEKAYQKVSMSVGSNNPYSSYIQDAVMEVGDIENYAQKVPARLDNGETVQQVAKDAIRLVVEPERSFVQVKGEDGQYVRVTPYGMGCSELKPGEVLYQDQAIYNKTLVPRGVQGSNATYYKTDSNGFRSIANHEVPIQATDLISSRHQVINAEQEVHYDSFNTDVDQGNFTLKDFKENSMDKKVTWVVEKNRSYLVMNGPNNKKSRITPYFDGNPRLPFGETLFKEFVVEGSRLHGFSKGQNLNSYRLGVDGEPLLVDPEAFPTVDVNKYLRPEPNKRLMRRSLIEQRRSKQGV